MVKGRKVKVRNKNTCELNDLSRDVFKTNVNNGNNETIETFLQVVVAVDESEPGKMNETVKEPPTTNGLQQSPPTPHRIELRNDSDDGATDVIKEVDCIVEKSAQPPKAKKRLNGVSGNLNYTTKATKDGPNGNHKLTEYFPIRRSARKTKKTVLEEKQRNLEYSLRNKIEDGLEVKCFDGKGRGVVASKQFNKGDFVVEYSGELIDTVEAKRRELKYAQDKSAGCYMYYFKHNDQQYCIDATPETGRLGRLVNHSRNGNLVTRTILLDNQPRLVLIAKTFIDVGDEVTYDYGDRSKESLRYHPWLAY